MEKIITSFLLGIIGVGVIFLIEGLIKLSLKISEQYGIYICIFIFMFIFGCIIQFSPDSENK